MEIFRAQGAGPPRADLLGRQRPRHARAPGRRTARARPRSTRWPRASAPTSGARGIAVTTILPGYIATDINVGRRGPFTVDLDTGVDALTAAIEREPVRAYVPAWPWRRSPGCCACCRCRSSAASPAPTRTASPADPHRRPRLSRRRRRRTRPRRRRAAAPTRRPRTRRARRPPAPGGAAARASTTSMTGAAPGAAGRSPGGALAVAHAGTARGTRAPGAPRPPVGRRVAERVVQRPDRRHQVPGLRRQRPARRGQRDPRASA